MLNIVLIEPQIPQNTGNIARTCVVADVKLHIVKPMGFEINEKQVKRAGLDYWKDLELIIYENIEEFYAKNKQEELWYFSSKVTTNYTSVQYSENCFLVFGSETAGLSKALLDKNTDYCVRIPIKNNQRCLNLSNAVCVATYEALRQNDFMQLAK